jgi:hypothetical protein
MKKYLIIGGIVLFVVILLVVAFVILVNSGILGNGDNKLNEENTTELIPYQDSKSKVKLKCEVTENLSCVITVDNTDEILPDEFADSLILDLTGKEFSELKKEVYEWECNLENSKCEKV